MALHGRVLRVRASNVNLFSARKRSCDGGTEKTKDKAEASDIMFAATKHDEESTKEPRKRRDIKTVRSPEKKKKQGGPAISLVIECKRKSREQQRKNHNITSTIVSARTAGWYRVSKTFMYDLSLNDQSPKQVGSPLQRSGLPVTFVSMVGVELAGPPSWYLLPLRDLTTQHGDFIDELLSLSLQCNEPSFHLEQTMLNACIPSTTCCVITANQGREEQRSTF